LRAEGLSCGGEKEKPAKKPKTKPAVKAKASKEKVVKKTVRATAVGTILDIITRAEKGVDTGTLKTETGFESNKMCDVIKASMPRERSRAQRRRFTLGREGQFQQFSLSPQLLLRN